MKLVHVILCCLIQILIVSIGEGQIMLRGLPQPASKASDQTLSGGFLNPTDDRASSPSKSSMDVLEVNSLLASSLAERMPEAPSPASKCPQLVIACPLDVVEQDTQLRFSAIVASRDLNPALTFTWSLSSGKVLEGQGTPSITVDTTGLGGGLINATVKIGGLARECPSAASCAIRIMKPTDARRLVNYGDLAFDLEGAHLAALAREMRNAPDSLAYIVVYGGRCSEETQALERAERAKEWLINKHGIDASRVVAIDGGYREDVTTEIYLGPVDATLAEPESSIQPLDKSRCK